MEFAIHNTSRKFHLSKLDFTKIKTNNIRMITLDQLLISVYSETDRSSLFFDQYIYCGKIRYLTHKNCQILFFISYCIIFIRHT